jgi:phospholipid/cholesterol/gamma-HCH transport system substrate-binding protein
VEILEGESPEMLQTGGRIPGVNVESLLDVPTHLGRDAQDVLQRIQGLLATPTVEAIEASAVELRDLLRRLSLLAEAQGEELAHLTASLNRSAQGFEEAAGSGDELARAVARADSALVTVNRTSDVLLRTATSLEEILGRIRAGEGTLGQLSTNPSLYLSISQAAESVKLLADDIRENPGRYVRVKIF